MSRTQQNGPCKRNSIGTYAEQASSTIPYVKRNVNKVGKVATGQTALAILCNGPFRFINLFLAFHEEMAENGESPLNFIKN